VTVDVKEALNTEQLRIINNDQSIYLTALKSFPRTRIYVTLQDSSEVMLLDLSIDKNATSTTQYIAFNQTVVTALPDVPLVSPEFDNISDVDRIRFAFQQVYAPVRLLKEMPRYVRAPMNTEPFVTDLVYGDKVIAHPTASWRMGDRIVTVVFLRNKYPHTTKIDLQQDLCGNWQSATIYPRATLKTYGELLQDSATLFLVSQKTFGETLGVCHGHA
jgi:integrating conjugative element protein (TIGR03749 family)